MPIIPDGISAYSKSKMWIAHNEEVGLFQEVRGLEQALVQKIVATVKEAYLEDIHNQTTNSIQDTMADELTQFQDNYGQLMPHKLLKREYIIKNMTYNHRDTVLIYISTMVIIVRYKKLC